MGGSDLAVNEVTCPRQGYAVQLKDLEAEHVSGFGADLRVVALVGPCFEYERFFGAVLRSAEFLLRRPALPANQIPWVRRTSAMCQSALLSFRSSSIALTGRLLGIRLPSGRRRE